ncbi:hypothetical protein ACIRPQ_12640 [Streptomyces sp. NPDC101213]|uniref:hypothetical protein n=1 Tax=Streptomyces sp. NPDC101213 TaxID=3366130 RepID=UPI003804F7F8
MDANELLALLVRHRRELRQWLDEDQYRHFLAMTERLREVGDDPERARMAVMAIVRSLWPVPDEAGVLAELLHANHRSIATETIVPTPEAVLAALEELYAAPAAGEAGEADRPDATGADRATRIGPAHPVADGFAHPGPVEPAHPGPVEPPHPDPAGPDPADPVAAVLAAARRRLLAVPCRAAAPAGSTAAGEGPADVIVLADPQDGPRSPDFQFDPDTGRPREIVVRINRILLADRDPWGAADWWLGRNSWLGGPPASLLGRVPDDRLADAALALVEEDGR